MADGYGSAGRGRRRGPAAVRRQIELLEQRDLLALVVGPLSLTEDLPFSGRIATFAAGDIQGTVADFRPSITWGDGTTGTGSVVADGAGYAVIAQKTYAAFGTFPVTVTVTGTQSSSVFGAANATVVDAPLTPGGSTAFAATAGQVFQGAVGSFQDVNTSSTGGDFAVTIDWGDGQTTLGAATLATTGQAGTLRYNVTGSHVYATPGTRPVSATVVRTSSGQTVRTTSTANVVDPALAATGLTVSGAPNQPLTNVVLATLTDTSTTSTPADFVATIGWGPGLPTTTATVAPVLNAGTPVPGRFAVSGSFTYPAPGTYRPLITVIRAATGQAASTAATVDVAAPTLVVQGTSLNPTAGVQFAGKVASFTDVVAGGTASDFTATIDWGNGQTTPGTVVPTAPGRYDVNGTFTYTTAGPMTATVTVTRVAGGQQARATTAVLVNPALSTLPVTTITASAGRLFSGSVATITDGQGGGTAAGLGASIDWGDGQTSPGTVVAVPSSSGVYNVYGTHVFAAAGNYPVRTTVVRAANGQSSTVTASAHVFTFTGGLDSLSLWRHVGNASVTLQELPIVSGTAEPGAVVSLTFRRVGGGDPIALGETVADSAGRWSLVVGPVAGTAFYLYGVAVPTTGPPSPITLLNDGRPIKVELHPVRVTDAFMGPAANRLTVVFRGARGINDPAGLAQPASYTLVGADGRTSTPISVRVARAGRSNATAPRTVTLTFGRDAVARGGNATLRFDAAVATTAGRDTTGRPWIAVRRARP